MTLLAPRWQTCLSGCNQADDLVFGSVLPTTIPRKPLLLVLNQPSHSLLWVTSSLESLLKHFGRSKEVFGFSLVSLFIEKRRRTEQDLDTKLLPILFMLFLFFTSFSCRSRRKLSEVLLVECRKDLELLRLLFLAMLLPSAISRACFNDSPTPGFALFSVWPRSSDILLSRCPILSARRIVAFLDVFLPLLFSLDQSSSLSIKAETSSRLANCCAVLLRCLTLGLTHSSMVGELSVWWRLSPKVRCLLRCSSQNSSSLRLPFTLSTSPRLFLLTPTTSVLLMYPLSTRLPHSLLFWNRLWGAVWLARESTAILSHPSLVCKFMVCTCKSTSHQDLVTLLPYVLTPCVRL